MIDISPYRLKIKTKLLGHNIVFYIGRNPNLATVGITNETPDSYFVPFIDYDDIYYDVVERDIKHIQSVFNLGTLIVLKNNEEKDVNGQLHGNYLVIGFDKLTFQQHWEMLTHTRCDRNYKAVPRYFKRRAWVLRIACKYYIPSKDGKPKIHKPAPKFKAIYPRKSKREGYYALKLFVEKYFKTPKINGFKWDNSQELEFIQYRTGSKEPFWSYLKKQIFGD